MNRPPAYCDGIRRREFVKFGALGLGLVDFLGLQAAASTPQGPTPARSCILIWLDGGPSHLETFDPKPAAPEEVRGPFAPLSTAVAGLEISELMPETAKAIRDVAIIRSVTSTQGEHNFGTHYLLTGYKSTPALAYPSYGSVVSQLRQTSGDLPPFIAVPHARVGGGKFRSAGYLPASTAPFQVGGDPSKPDFRVRNLDPFPGVTSARLARRRQFQQKLAEFQQDTEAGGGPGGADFEQAFRLVTSKETRAAFDLEAEPRAVRDRYGRKSIGQSCLLARRLVERGVPFVTVNNTGWDTHQDLVTRLKDGYAGARKPVGLIPSLDLAFSALVEDLKARGLLEQTLIVVMGEFGRTPKLNTAGGRDHWPRVFSVAMAGAGIPGGQVIGSSDDVGESPRDRPITPADLAATIYTLLGIDPDHTLYTRDGRPVKLSHGGIPVTELLG